MVYKFQKLPGLGKKPRNTYEKIAVGSHLCIRCGCFATESSPGSGKTAKQFMSFLLALSVTNFC